MKKTLILCIFTLFVLTSSFSQTSEDCTISQLVINGKHNFQVIGNDVNPFIDSLFSHYPKTKRKGYIWKFKKISISGLEDPITLHVHQGIYGRTAQNESDSTKCNGGFYFTTFTSKKYRRYRLDNLKENEQKAINIYIKKGRKYGISNEEDVKIIKLFLLAIYES